MSISATHRQKPVKMVTIFVIECCSRTGLSEPVYHYVASGLNSLNLQDIRTTHASQYLLAIQWVTTDLQKPKKRLAT